MARSRDGEISCTTNGSCTTPKSTGPRPTGRVKLGVEFAKTAENPKFVANGIATLYIGEKAVGQQNIRTQPGAFALAGGGLFVGRSSPDAVTKEYPPPAAFTGGTIHSVSVNIKGEKFVDLEVEGLRALARD